MKKLLSVIALAIICLTVVFAKGNVISFSIVPYGIQISTSSEESQNPIVSSCGIGSEVSYSRYLTDGLFSETSLSWDSFLFPERSNEFSHILVMTGVGYTFGPYDTWQSDVRIKVGADILFFERSVSETFAILAGMNASYAFSENLSFNLGCDEMVSLAKNNFVTYANYRILPKAGFSFGF